MLLQKNYGTVQDCTAISVLKYDRSITRFKTIYIVESTCVYNHTVDENKFVYTNNYEFCRFLNIISSPPLYSADVWIETEVFVFNKDGGLQHCVQDEQLSDSQLESSFRAELDCLQPQAYLLDSNEWATSEYVHITDS